MKIRVLLFDANKVERKVLEDKALEERYQFALNELKTGVCVGIMTLTAFRTLFNDGYFHINDCFVYFYKMQQSEESKVV